MKIEWTLFKIEDKEWRKDINIITEVIFDAARQRGSKYMYKLPIRGITK